MMLEWLDSRPTEIRFGGQGYCPAEFGKPEAYHPMIKFGTLSARFPSCPALRDCSADGKV